MAGKIPPIYKLFTGSDSGLEKGTSPNPSLRVVINVAFLQKRG